MLPKGAAPDLEGLLVHLERLVVMPLLEKDARDIAEARSNNWMPLAVHAAVDAEGLLVGGPRLRQLARFEQNTAKVVERGGNVTAVVAMCYAIDPQGFLVYRPGLVEPPQSTQAVALARQNKSHKRVLCPGRL